MLSILDPLRKFSFFSVCLRLLVALVCGGAVGYGRSKKARPAGLRTYMIIAIGAAMSVILTLYLSEMLSTAWRETALEVGEKFDASRLASQVVTGIGFLGAGIIIKAAHQEVSGLTTSTGLFAAVCMGLAAGAGFYMGRLGAAIKDTPQFELEVLYNDKENLDMVQRYLKDNRMSIVNLRIQPLQPESGSHYSAEITVRGGRDRDEFIDRIQLMDGINSVIHI